MKTDYSYLLKEYPETISMGQLYKICHVSKRKARWLLEHGVIPCKDSWKKTRRFAIKIKDVINFLEMQEAGKLKAVQYQRGYLIPKEWLIHYLAETVNDGRASKSQST